MCVLYCTLASSGGTYSSGVQFTSILYTLYCLYSYVLLKGVGTQFWKVGHFFGS